MAMGTAGYMSPEQVRGEKLDTRTDLFSFGLVLYEMATGQRAFTGQTAAILKDAILNQTPVPIRELNASMPASVEQIIDKAIQKDRERRYQSTAEMRTDLQKVQSSGRPTATKSVRRRWKEVGIAAVIVAVMVAGVLYWRSRSKLKLTNKDTIVLADLTNHTSDGVFDDALNTALRTELQQTPFLNVLAPDKVRRTLRLLDRPEHAKVTPEIAREICVRTNSKAVVASSIMDVGNHFRIELKGINCETGTVFAQVKQDAVPRNEVIHALGVLGVQLRDQLGEPGPSLERFNKSLDEPTTPSLEALQAYTVGVRRSEEQGSIEALPYLKTAVELDPSFARAYAKLGNETDGKVSTQYFEKAYKLRDRLSERDRLYVEGHYYGNANDFEKSFPIWFEWIRTYPNDYDPYVLLGSDYSNVGQYEKGATAVREALRLEPEHSGAASELMMHYLAMNRLDEAKGTLQKHKSQEPGWSVGALLRIPSGFFGVGPCHNAGAV
jgi:eukaryotic-like serine/threonine-protein kinase